MTNPNMPPRTFRHTLHRWARRMAKTVFALLLLGVGAMLLQQLTGNFHAVAAGEFYRSAQMDASEIAGPKERYGIRTIINLRGAGESDWYVRERAESERLGITHLSYGLSAGRELTQAQVEDLIALMREAPKPILVHCRGGADRSGIAAALYLAVIAGAGEEAAEWQLSPLYGHIPLPFAPAWAMDETFERIEPWLGFPDS